MTPLCHNLRFGLATVLFAMLWTGKGAFSSDREGQEHWSLRPIQVSEVPSDVNGVDFFIKKKLSEKKLDQNPTADPHTLLRRVTINLTGLPPTREEMQAFIESDREQAYNALVDRLLDSPHYGERWGRHWLDIARYVQGAIKVPGVDQIDLAIPYRDYVVKSFNEDKPFDQFLTEQLAGDLIAEEAETEEEYFDRIIAPAFLSIGQWFDECTDPNKLRLDIIDEQISTTTRAFLAMDFACARCHDHKFDPIPTRDYYALAGIFRSTEITSQFAQEWKDGRPRRVTTLATPSEKRALAASENEYSQLVAERWEILERLRQTRVLKEEAFADFPGTIDGEILSWEAEDFAGHKNLKIETLELGEVLRSRKLDDRWVKYRVVLPEPGDYTLLVRYAAKVASPVTLELELKDQPEPILTEATYGESAEAFRWEAISLPNQEQGSLHIRFKTGRHVPFPVLDSFKLVQGNLEPQDLSWRRQIGKPSLAETAAYLSQEDRAKIDGIESRIRKNLADRPRFEKALSVQDAVSPTNLPIHIGGDVYRTEDEPVPRGVPSLAHSNIDQMFSPPEDQSGRIKLAQWLCHPDHPLTARVLVNRIWHWHFGKGIVRTTDDFGIQGSLPSHPELLDWLAAELIQSDWSIKHIHRVIMNSETYRASSEATSLQRAKDPEAVWLSHFPKRRLEAEAIYDGMLTSIGKVPRQQSGASLDTNQSKDRALYILTSSRSPVGLGLEIRKMFSLFGVDDSGRPMHDRDETSTSKQALWWLNNPLPRYYADTFARQVIETYSDPIERAKAAHETILGRPLSASAADALLAYVVKNEEKGLSSEEAWSRTCLALFSSQAFSHLE